MTKIEVREVKLEAELEALYSFRYKVYVEELGMTDQADHARKWLQDGYDEESVHYAIFSDGDTLKIWNQGIRLEGIDAPETAQTCTKIAGSVWKYGEAAATYL